MADGMENKDHSGHRDRMRKRFMSDRSLSGFSQHEILEMLLYLCYPRTNTNVLAHKLIESFGSLNKVLRAEPEDLVNTGLMGEAPAQMLSFLDAASRYLRTGEGFEPVELTDIKKVKEYVRGWFDGDEEEIIRVFPVVHGIYLGGSFIINRGGVHDIKADAQAIHSTVSKLGSQYVFLAHNHPMTESTPSEKDVVETRLLLRALKDYRICILDHYIIGRDGVCSMRSKGKIHDFE